MDKLNRLFAFIISMLTIQFSLAQTTYSWSDSSSGGAWNESSNWTPISGPGTTFPGSGDIVIISPTATITITNVPAISIDSILVDGATGADTVTLTAVAADTLFVTDNITVTGGAIKAGTNMVFYFDNGSAYNHERDAGAIPIATWGTGSICNLTGIVDTAPENITQNFYNFLWDNPGQKNVIFLYGNFPTGIDGTFEMRRCGTSSQVNWDPPSPLTWAGDIVISANRNLILTNSSTSTAKTFTVRDVYLTNAYGNASKLIMNNAGNTSNFFTFNIRNLYIDSSYLDFNGIYQNNTIVNCSGNVTVINGAIWNSNDLTAGTSEFNFNGTTQQNINITGVSEISGYYTEDNPIRTLVFNVNSGAIVDFVSPFACGAGSYVTFSALAGSTLMIPDENGITAGAGATTGSVQVPATGGTSAFSTTANYTFNGTTYQITGSGVPATVNNLTINNISGSAPGVSLSGAKTVNGTLTLTYGVLTLGNYNLTLSSSNPASLVGTASASTMIIPTGTGIFTRGVAAGANSYLFPVGDPTPNYTPVNLTLVSNAALGTVGVRVTDSTEPNNNNPSAPAAYLSRYWTLSNSLSTYSYTGTFAYPEANVNGTESILKVSRWTGSAWTEDDAGSSDSPDLLTITTPLTQATMPLAGDITGRTQCIDSTYVINYAICSGQSYQGHTATGTYMDTFTVTGGCDSIVELNLMVQSLIQDTINQSICSGLSYSGHSATGTYIDTFTATGGCDSIRILNLTVLPVSRDTISQTICQGNSFDGYNATGTYLDTFIAGNGCDSIRTLSLAVLNVSRDTISQGICQGNSFDGHSATGTYVDTFQGANGCDSIRTLNLLVHSVSRDTFIQSICLGSSFDGYTATGIYVDTFNAVNGCDSIRTLNLTVTSIIRDTIDQSICQGSSFDGYTLTGTYTDTFTAVGGCDSARTLILIVLSPISDTVSQSICHGSSFDGYNATGTYVDTFQTLNGCDSIRTLNLAVNPTVDTTIKTRICVGDTFQHHTISGTYYDTLTASGGCDSIVTIGLEVDSVPVLPVITQEGDTLFTEGGYSLYNWYTGTDSLLFTGTNNFYVITQSGTYYVEVFNGGCSKNSQTDTVLTMGIETVALNSLSLSVYPNPASDMLNIKLAGITGNNEIILKLYDALGRLILDRTSANEASSYEIQLDVKDFNQGLYLLQVCQGTQNIERQVIIGK